MPSPSCYLYILQSETTGRLYIARRLTWKSASQNTMTTK